MNHERAELIDAIRSTIRSMRECANSMGVYGLGNNDIEIIKHAHEMHCAADTAETWAKGLEE